MTERRTGRTTKDIERCNILAEICDTVWFVVHDHNFAFTVQNGVPMELHQNVRVITARHPHLVMEPHPRVRGSDAPVVIDHFVWEGGVLD